MEDRVQWDGPVHEGACRQHQISEFGAQASHSKNRTNSNKLSSDIHMFTETHTRAHAHVRMHTHDTRHTEINKCKLSVEATRIAFSEGCSGKSSDHCVQC